MESQRNPSGIPMESQWNPNGILMESQIHFFRIGHLFLNNPTGIRHLFSNNRTGVDGKIWNPRAYVRLWRALGTHYVDALGGFASFNFRNVWNDLQKVVKGLDQNSWVK